MSQLGVCSSFGCKWTVCCILFDTPWEWTDIWILKWISLRKHLMIESNPPKSGCVYVDKDSVLVYYMFVRACAFLSSKGQIHEWMDRLSRMDRLFQCLSMKDQAHTWTVVRCIFVLRSFIALQTSTVHIHHFSFFILCIFVIWLPSYWTLYWY